MREAHEVADGWRARREDDPDLGEGQNGAGSWLRGITEHCLLAIRGRPAYHLTNQTSLLAAPRREHSRKHDEFYELAEATCPG